MLKLNRPNLCGQYKNISYVEITIIGDDFLFDFIGLVHILSIGNFLIIQINYPINKNQKEPEWQIGHLCNNPRYHRYFFKNKTFLC